MAQGDLSAANGMAVCRLYNEDCIEGMRRLLEDGSVDVVVTSPPYNLGVGYRRYDDTISREEYLLWTDRWAAEVRRVLSPGGSFFLNVGGKPRDPWVPFDVLGVMRRHFVLQNTIHWIKSIAIQKRDVGDYPGITGDVSVGHYKPINSSRFLNDCHEYIFHLTLNGDVELDRLAVGVPYQDASNIGRWRSAAGGSALPWKYLVHPLPDHPQPGLPEAAPRHISCAAAGDVHAVARGGAHPPGDGSVPGHRAQRAGGGAVGGAFCGVRDR